MNNKLEKKITKRFEFMRTSGDLMKDLLVFGFECSDGWFQIIWDLCIDLEKMDIENQKTIPADVKAKSILEYGYNVHELKVVQVKEKFGTLRFYTQGSTDEMWRRIQESEKMSSETCEICGKPGKILNDGWVSVRCNKCRKKKDG